MRKGIRWHIIARVRTCHIPARVGKWILPESMQTSERDYLCVYPDKGRDFDGYYLTWALIPFREIAA